MMINALRILFVSTNQRDTALMKAELEEAFDVEWTAVNTAGAFRDALGERDVDLVLSCCQPAAEFNAPEALAMLKEMNPDIAFVVLTGGAEERAAIQLLTQGADDYVRLDNPERLVLAVKQSLTKREEAGKRASMEEKRREKERLLRLVFDHTSHFIGLMTPDGTMIDANRTALEFAGLSESDVIGKPFWETPWWLHSPELQEKLRSAVLRASSGEFVRFDAHHPGLDGSIHWIDGSLTPVKDERGSVVYLIPEGRDVTDRKRAEERLRQSEERYRALVDENPYGVQEIDKEGTILFANAAHCRMLGYENEELVGRCITDFQEPGPRRDELPGYLKMLVEEQPAPASYFQKNLMKGGEVRDIEISWNYLRDEAGSVRGFLSILTDITDRKRSEEELAKYQHGLSRLVEERTAELRGANDSLRREIAERAKVESRLKRNQKALRALAKELSLAEDRERKRLAADLHDRIAQNLAIASLKLDALRKRLTTKESEIAQQVGELVAQSIRETRALVFEMSPPILDELGLEAAIEWLARTLTEAHGIPCTVEADQPCDPLDEDLRTILFQGVRELLFNVIKHSRATAARVRLNEVEGATRIEVQDDGVGFDTAIVKRPDSQDHGFGLFSLGERLRFLGGDIRITSNAEPGTRVEMTVPTRCNA